jgi:ribosome-associated toxin RatA of RatAB toxin-antitoxin module
MSQITAHRRFDAPTDVVWAVVTDPDVYATVAPNLSSVTIREGDGEGMVRECIDTRGNTWTESCRYWEAGRGFAVAVDVETSDFHRRWFTRFEGRWDLEARPDGVLVTMRFDFDAKYGPLGSLLERYFQFKAPSLTEAIFDGWDAEIRARTVEREPPIEKPDAPHDGTRTNRRSR